jgi:hypothetical protein
MFKYGERLYIKRYTWLAGPRYAVYRFRIDPVYIWKYKYRFRYWYKRPKTTQERRLSYKYRGYVRGRRTAPNLVNAYDDRQRGDVKTRKSWKKNKVRKQWMR